MSSLQASSRISKVAAAFEEELRLDPLVFRGFYKYARRKVFLEALNFFIEAPRPSCPSSLLLTCSLSSILFTLI